MIYTTISKIKDSLGDKKDMIIADIDDNRLADIIADQSAYIDGYLRIRYDLPIDENNPILERICLLLSKTEIYRLFAANDIPETVKEQEIQARKELEKIQKGEIIIKKDTNADDEIISKPTYHTEWL
ncbi:MAG: phage protein Gp36 family protein [Candidatus Ratteibacteria bacterium]|jgi:phage gp36-like protein|nr:DUF1320 family protein [Candidatus Cloacimonadota bacterium]HOQ79955.1 DUF1320 family protein [Candidatus Cloacimonadota bacterium]HPK40001.1 DUF1320 family protein [Candidatus Cloacimonadota bacterium]